MSSDRKVVASFALDAAQAKQNLDDLRAAEERFTAEGKTLASSLSGGFEDVEDRVGKAFKRLSEGGSVSQAEFDRIVSKLGAVREAAEATGVPIEQLPAEIQSGFGIANQQVQALADAMEAARERTAAVREEFIETNAVTRRAAELAEEVAEKYGEIPERIDDIRSASDRTFDEQRRDLEAIEKALNDEARALDRLGDVGEPALRRVRTESERVEKALKELSEESTGASGKVRDGFIRTERALQDLGESVDDVSPKMAADFARAGVQVDRLRADIEAARKTGGVVTDEQLARLSQFEKKLESSRGEVENLTDSLGEMKDRTKEGGENWSGLGDAIGKAAGPMGATVAKAGMISAALKEGWELGMKFNEWVGTDLSLLEEFLDRTAKKTGIVIREWAAGLFELGRLVKEVFTFGEGYEDRVLKVYDEFKTTISEAASKVRDLDATLAAEEEAQKRAAAAAKATAEAEELARQAAEKLKEEKRRLKEEIDGVVKSLRDENTELEKQKVIEQESTLRVVDRGDQLGYYKRQLDEINGSVARQRAEVAGLTATYGEHDPFVTQALEKLRVLESSLRAAQERYNDTTEEVRRYEQQQAQAASAIERQTQTIRDLSQRQSELEKSVTSLGGKTDAATTSVNQQATATGAAATAAAGAATATTQQATATDAATTAVRGYRDEAGKLVITNKELAETGDKAAVALKSVSAAVDITAEQVTRAEALAVALASIRDRLGEIAKIAPDAQTAIKNFSEACDDAAGEDYTSPPAGTFGDNMRAPS